MKIGNRPQKAPARGPKLPAPKSMPPHPTGEKWNANAERYWAQIWSADARHYWLPEDLPLIERCAFYAQEIGEGRGSVAMMSEWRRTEEALYLSPGSRQRARISPSAPAVAGASTSKAPALPAGGQSQADADELAEARAARRRRLEA